MRMVAYAVRTINMLGIILSSFYIYGKATCYPWSNKRRLLSIIWCLLCSLIYAVKPIGILLLMVIYAANIIFLWITNDSNINLAISGYLLSLGISYSFLQLAMLLIGVLFSQLRISYTGDSLVNYCEPIYLLIFSLITSLQLLMSYLLFRVKRFKRGFPFLFERHTIILALIVSGFVFIMVSLVSIPRDNYEDYYLLSSFVGVLISGTGIIIWIKRGIRMFYRRKLQDNNFTLLTQELAAKDCEIERLTQQNDILRTESHKINHRLSALERSAAALVSRTQLMKISEELAVTLEDIRRLSWAYQEGLMRLKEETPLPSTKIKAIDDLLAYFAEHCAEKDINFSLKVSGSIPYMTEHIISQNRLETMLGDHLQDALDAVNMSNSAFRRILVLLGLADNRYELTIFDSGVPFEPDILAKLGTEHVTTHADGGGSGIGFMTTFEALRECGASLIISEKKQSSADYTKSVAIRFDGLNRYVVETYRPEELSARHCGNMVVQVSNGVYTNVTVEST